jgi:hypothetical protein
MGYNAGHDPFTLPLRHIADVQNWPAIATKQQEWRSEIIIIDLISL